MRNITGETQTKDEWLSCIESEEMLYYNTNIKSISVNVMKIRQVQNIHQLFMPESMEVEEAGHLVKRPTLKNVMETGSGAMNQTENGLIQTASMMF
ncbi:MAG: hypothetical protein A370_01251 [Clostridium sp. Maddingley MBC34-26]|uniref:hypothetical protein n=1 Tax=Clostridium sp. LS TaxID=1352601 RepID=UPI000297A237|nr:hypothetical protein [Clostridium sp. LS]EKQ57111.1 MAG: hypothetical protein A370_01251 [Clostridium sp. Maddingley MBC34-26]